MERVPTHAAVSPTLDAALLGSAAAKAAEAAAALSDPASAIDASTGALYEAIAGVLPSVFVVEHGRLWLVAQRGYAVVPDGIRVESGVVGRAVRLGRSQLVTDVREDPDYVAALPGVRSELAVPLRAGPAVVGALNIESERTLPAEAPSLVRPLAAALAPLAAALRARRTLDLAALARLFVYFSSLRDAGEIAALATASLPKVLPVDVSQVVLWDDVGTAVELAVWRADDTGTGPLSVAEVDGGRSRIDSSVVCQLLDPRGSSALLRRRESVIWLPLRANGEELGALIGVVGRTIHVDPAQLDTAALLAAHVAVSLDAAVALERERHSAATDPLTGILNRRGLEEHLEGVLDSAQAKRVPVSLLVIDCDDFKDVNDRAGHEFGDALLVEVAHALEDALPEGADAARLGGDEFVVVLPGADTRRAQDVGREIRSVLLEGLTEAGFPLRISGGIATYPFDGGNPGMLLRAADQALYAAKDRGRDQISSFRDVVRRERTSVRDEPAVDPIGERRSRTGRSDGSVLAEAMEAAAAIELETTVGGVCSRLCKSLVFVVGATACLASRVVGELVVDTAQHALREISLGEAAAYRLSDFPLTWEVLRSGQPVAISFLDDDVDPAEAFILRELDMNALLMLPMRVGADAWGLVELYEMRLQRFSDDDVAVARFLVSQAERRLQALGPDEELAARPPVYVLPPGDAGPRGPRTR